jgi:hypothetical protein
MRERKEKKRERRRREHKRKAKEVANLKEDERQQAKVTRRVAGTDAPYIDPPSDKPPR